MPVAPRPATLPAAATVPTDPAAPTKPPAPAAIAALELFPPLIFYYLNGIETLLTDLFFVE